MSTTPGASLFEARHRIRMDLSRGHLDVSVTDNVSRETLDALRAVGEAALNRMEVPVAGLKNEPLCDARVAGAQGGFCRNPARSGSRYCETHDAAWIGPVLIKHAINRAIQNKEEHMASTRCKFTCHSVIEQSYGKVVNLSAVYAPDDPESENGKFWSATPNGQIALVINNPDGAAVFEQGKQYYVDFAEAE